MVALTDDDRRSAGCSLGGGAMPWRGRGGGTGASRRGVGEQGRWHVGHDQESWPAMVGSALALGRGRAMV